MHTVDRDQFFALLDTCADVFGKPKLDDIKAQVYWRALRDLPFERVKHGVDMHLRFGKFFPKPSELRPKGDKPPLERSAIQDADLHAAEKYNRRTWELLRAQDPTRDEYEIGIARAARAMAGLDESSPVYAQALCEYRRWMDARNVAWEAVRRPHA